jgi:hypothetical protein
MLKVLPNQLASPSLALPLKPDGTPVRVLYALDQFPQLSESYIDAEINRMQSWGFHVEVWSNKDPKSEGGECDVTVHRGKLEDAIAKVKPDIVHTHWTKSAIKYRDAARRMRKPMTARGHWHFIPDQLVKLEQDDTIVRLYMFPHLANRYGSIASKIRPMHACFHEEWLAPKVEKNRRMIVRTAACKKSKDLDCFIRIASRLNGYRCVLILCSLGPNDHYRELEQLNRDLGSPVEMVRDITHREVAAYLAEAGIYLHTYNPDVSFGMPVSIAEAMAAGCTIFARDVDGARAFLGNAGKVYADENQAVQLVNATEKWSDEEWAEAAGRSTQRAWSDFDDHQVLLPLRQSWIDIASQPPSGNEWTPLGRIKRWFGLAA